MTIDETAEKWGCSTEKVLNLVYAEKIDGISVNNGTQLNIPDIPKPFSIPSNAKNSHENIYKYIVLAVEKGNYLDCHVFGDWNITKEAFKAHMQELMQKDIIMKENDSVSESSTMGFLLTTNGVNVAKEYHTSKALSVMKELGLEIISQLITQAIMGGK